MEYKFYLAFENTAGCKDYITYKFWKNAIYRYECHYILIHQPDFTRDKFYN